MAASVDVMEDHMDQQDESFMSEGKRQKCDGAQYQDSCPREHVSYADIIQSKSEVEKDDGHWETLRGMASALMEDSVQKQNLMVQECEEDETFNIEIDTKEFLKSFENFYDKAVIMFFTGKIPTPSWVRQWLRNVMQEDCVEDIYVGPRGFYEVMLLSQALRGKLFNRLPLFYERGLVHVVPWRPVVEFQEILKRECPVWVEVQCQNSVVWPLLTSSMEKLGKVLVPPRANAQNRYRLCLLWNTTKKRPTSISLCPIGLPFMRFKLNWGTFAGHCFKCGVLGHFMAECPRKEMNVIGKHSDTIEEQLLEQMDHMEEVTEEVQTVGPKINVVDKGKEKVEDVVREEHKPWTTQARRPKSTMHNQREKVGVENKRNEQQTWFAKGRVFNHGRDLPQNLNFRTNGRVFTPWDTRKLQRHQEGPSTSKENDKYSQSNPYAVLGDFFQDVIEKLAQKESMVTSSKAKASSSK